MEHLTTDKLAHLARLVAEDLAFHSEDVTDMQHIGQCEDCYRKLHRFLIVEEALNHLGARVLPTRRSKSADSAVIQVTILPTRAILEQLYAQAAAWVFDEPLQLGITRSSGSSASSVRKLEDLDDPHTFVAYDPEKKLLVIQLAHTDGQPVPKARLELADGTMKEIAFTRHDGFLTAQVSGLEEGEYRIYLEK